MRKEFLRDGFSKSFSLFAKKVSFALILTAALSSCLGPTVTDKKRDYYEKEDGTHRLDRWLHDADMVDPHGELGRDDYEKLFYSPMKDPKKQKGSEPDLPNVSKLMMAPKPAVIADDKLVTLSVTQDVDLKDVLVELARRAEVDMEVDPGISGKIIFSVKDRPFSEVIDRVSKMANLRYKVEDGVLKIERDTPYIVNYKMNMLNMTRKQTSAVKVNTTLSGGASSGGASSSGSSGGDDSFGGGSKSLIESTSSKEDDVWAAVSSGVSNILNQYKVKTDEEAALDQINRSSSSAQPGQLADGVLSVNRQAGLVSVLATDRQHKEIKSYLDYVMMQQSSQVLIEAKVLEVRLNDEYHTGIDWNFLNSNVTGLSASTKFSDLGLPQEDSKKIFSVGVLPAELFGFDNTSIEASLNFLETFGVTRALSSPRIQAMNNQYAVLSFAKNHIYFDLTIEQETEESGSSSDTNKKITIESEVKSIPLGVILALQPSIDVDKNEIVMNVRPTLSRLVDEIADPAVGLSVAQILSESTTSDAEFKAALLAVESQVPVVETREMDSILRIKSGEVMVIGGLMEDRTENEDRGVPGASEVPILGNAFKNVSKESNMVETVIFIKATIVPGSGVSVEDKDFYKKFARDRRPLM